VTLAVAPAVAVLVARAYPPCRGRIPKRVIRGEISGAGLQQLRFAIVGPHVAKGVRIDARERSIAPPPFDKERRMPALPRSVGAAAGSALGCRCSVARPLDCRPRWTAAQRGGELK
jgi:hypothetical protein